MGIFTVNPDESLHVIDSNVSRINVYSNRDSFHNDFYNNSDSIFKSVFGDQCIYFDMFFENLNVSFSSKFWLSKYYNTFNPPTGILLDLNDKYHPKLWLIEYELSNFAKKSNIVNSLYDYYWLSSKSEKSGIFKEHILSLIKQGLDLNSKKRTLISSILGPNYMSQLSSVSRRDFKILLLSDQMNNLVESMASQLFYMTKALDMKIMIFKKYLIPQPVSKLKKTRKNTPKQKTVQNYGVDVFDSYPDQTYSFGGWYEYLMNYADSNTRKIVDDLLLLIDQKLPNSIRRPYLGNENLLLFYSSKSQSDNSHLGKLFLALKIQDNDLHAIVRLSSNSSNLPADIKLISFAKNDSNTYLYDDESDDVSYQYFIIDSSNMLPSVDLIINSYLFNTGI